VGWLSNRLPAAVVVWLTGPEADYRGARDRQDASGTGNWEPSGRLRPRWRGLPSPVTRPGGVVPRSFSRSAYLRRTVLRIRATRKRRQIPAVPSK